MMKVSVMSVGLERTVCEECGMVSFASSGELTGEVVRDQFARPADQSGAGSSALEGSVSR